MKELAKVGVGGDGGHAALLVESGMLKLELSYPVAKVLAPLKEKVVGKLKEFLPDWGDALLDKGWDDLVKSVSDVPEEKAAE